MIFYLWITSSYIALNIRNKSKQMDIRIYFMYMNNWIYGFGFNFQITVSFCRYITLSLFCYTKTFSSSSKTIESEVLKGTVSERRSTNEGDRRWSNLCRNDDDDDDDDVGWFWFCFWWSLSICSSWLSLSEWGTAGTRLGGSLWLTAVPAALSVRLVLPPWAATTESDWGPIFISDCLRNSATNSKPG